MNWDSVFNDIKKWMEASNVMSQKYSITSDVYWDWLLSTLGKIGNRYDNHPVVLGFITTLIKIQEENYKKVAG
ncbi:TPA: hypothetical protein I0F89_RS00675 [Enterococcus faecalis]|nr:hypothetical protein [Enterococcus faecalis]HBI1736670.1 hypothetical protein [Enterococcus faecalis]HBI1739407.1 hypothetical protein [Enterococcus faecalis]HBI1742266.1 hypothetical protein [Enterococcus faecalis]HBI1745604.1 hypothetical protein [Enterococcus faecalis]